MTDRQLLSSISVHFFSSKQDASNFRSSLDPVKAGQGIIDNRRIVVENRYSTRLTLLIIVVHIANAKEAF